RIETAFLKRDSQLGRGDRIVGEKNRNAEFHLGILPPSVSGDARPMLSLRAKRRNLDGKVRGGPAIHRRSSTMRSIVGTWKMVAAAARDRDGNALPAPYGGKGMGRVMFNAEGRMMAVTC